MDYDGFEEYGLELETAFNKKKMSEVIFLIPEASTSMNKFNEYCRNNYIKLGILKRLAWMVYDMMVKNHISAI